MYVMNSDIGNIGECYFLTVVIGNKVILLAAT